VKKPLREGKKKSATSFFHIMKQFFPDKKFFTKKILQMKLFFESDIDQSYFFCYN